MISNHNFIQNVKDELHQNGYCVIPNVLTTEEVDYALQCFKEWQSSLPENAEEIHDKLDPHGIYKHHEVAHQRHAWFVRTRPAVQNIFKALWNVPIDDPKGLITGFDGSTYVPADCNKEDKCWTHSDQAPAVKGLQCYQGFIALTTNSQRTFRVYEGSHNMYEQYCSDRGLETGENCKKNWNLIDPEYLDTIQELKRVLHVEAGSLVLWDSRCFHQGQYGQKGCNEERYIQYVCYLPRNHPKNTKAISAKRRKYFEERRTTSHWPAPIWVNPKQPRNFGNSNLIINYAELQPPRIDDLMDEIECLL